MTDAPPTEKQPRSKRGYVLWGVSAVLLAALAAFSWLVVAPRLTLERWLELVLVLTVVLSTYISVRATRLGCRWTGVLIGTLLIWLVPVAIRSWLAFNYGPEFGGPGLGIHFICGWAFSGGYCYFVSWIARKKGIEPDEDGEVPPDSGPP